MESGLLALIALAVMLIGFIGILVPGIPAVPIVWLGAALYAVLDRFQHVSVLTFLVLTLLGAVGTTAGLWGSQLATRAGGGSGWSATAGSCLAALGLIFFTLPIALVLALAGVFGIELRRRRNPKVATLSSAGWLVGWLFSAIVEFVISLAMIGIFLWSVLSRTQ